MQKKVTKLLTIVFGLVKINIKGFTEIRFLDLG